MTMKNAYYEYEQDIVDSLVEDGVDPDDVQVARLFAEVLWSFHWAPGHTDEALGKIGLTVDDGRLALELEVWVADNDNPADHGLKPLSVITQVDRFRLPEDQIRSLIHAYLCHEADEQMWFNAARPFHPHHEVTA